MPRRRQPQPLLHVVVDDELHPDDADDGEQAGLQAPKERSFLADLLQRPRDAAGLGPLLEELRQHGVAGMREAAREHRGSNPAVNFPRRGSGERQAQKRKRGNDQQEPRKRQRK